MSTPDDDTLREWIAAADPAKPWPGRDAAHDARLEELACAAPSLAAEVLRLRAIISMPCPACSARGRRQYAREIEDGCDDCDATGRVIGPAPRYITTSRPGAVIEVQEHRLSPEERKALDFCRKPFGGGR